MALIYAYMKNSFDEGEDIQCAVNSLDVKAFAYLPIYLGLRYQNANRVYLEVEAE